MFRWFEKRLDPFPPEEPIEPPKTLVAFCVHYTRGAWPYILVDAVLVAAIAIANRIRPEVVLLDIGLPGMNGYEVARALKNSDAHTPMALIAVSGYGQDEDRRRSREAGFDHHLLKPVDPAELSRAIDALDRRH